MIDVKQAVSRAVTEANNLYAGQRLQDIQLEEVEITEDGKFWLITLGFYIVAEGTLPEQYITALGRKREYKVFKIERETGNLISMKMRVA